MTLRLPQWNLQVNTVERKGLPPLIAKGTEAQAGKVIPIRSFPQGELDMPMLTPCPLEKRAYILKSMKVGDGALPEDKRALADLCMKYHQAFGAHPYDLGTTDSYVHDIQLKDE